MGNEPLTVLLVEDSDGDADLIGEYLDIAENGAQFEMERVVRAADAETRLSDGSSTTDVVLLDLGLPDSQGLKTLARVQAAAGDVPVVVLTGFSDETVALRAVRNGAKDYLVKEEVSPTLLSRSIRYAVEHARADTRLRQQERWFRALVEHSSDAVMVLDPDATIRYASPSLERLMGYDPAERIGRPAFEDVHPDDLDRMREALTAVLEEPDVVVKARTRARHADGTWRTLSGTLQNLLEDRAVEGLVLTVHDVTDLETQRQALVERVKEQRCLYDISTRLLDETEEMDTLLQWAVERIPAGFLYPGRTDARLAIGGRTFATPGFAPTPHRLESSVPSEGAEPGLLEVHIADPPDADEPFLHEEKLLLDALAERIGEAVRHREVRAALVRSEAHFRAITENSADGVAIIDPEGRIQYASPRFSRLLALDASGSDPDDLTASIHPDDRDRFLRLLEEVLEEPGATRDAEVRCGGGEGGLRTLEAVAQNSLDDPAVRGIVLNVRDISDRKRAERERRESVEKYETLFETMGQGVVYQTTEGEIVAANAAAERILGLTLDQMKGRTSGDSRWDAIREDGTPFPEEEHPSMVALREGRHVDDTIMGIFRPDEQRYRWIQIDARPQIRPGEDEPYEVHTIFEDITERKRSQEALHRRDAILEAVSFTAGHFLTTDDVGGEMERALVRIGEATEVDRISVFSRTTDSEGEGEERLRYEWTGEGVPALDTPELTRLRMKDDAPGVLERLRAGEIVRGRLDELVEAGHPRRTGREGSFLTLVPIFVGEDWWGFLGFENVEGERFWTSAVIEALRTAAVTLGSAIRRQEIERSLREKDEQLLQAQKMEAVGRLAGGVAHDFNNVLTVISGHTDLLLSELTPADPLRADVEAIRTGADRAASLTRQLLAFSRKQVLNEAPLDLSEIVGGTTPMLQRLLSEVIRIETDLGDGLWPVEADRGQMEQILVNLAVNAGDAMGEEGGTLRISTRNRSMDRDVVDDLPWPMEPGDYVCLTVSDTGPGMTDDVMIQIFEPFFTTKELGKGTGLGLSTVYGIVKQSGGYVSVSSEPQEGTTFTIFLPRAESAVRPGEGGAGSSARRKLPSGSGTILVVEDDAPVRALTTRVLKRMGYTVRTAADGKAALSLAREMGEPPDLLLSDVVMPNLGGTSLAAALREENPDLRVVLTSGYTEDELVQHGVRDGEFHFLEKPFTPKELATLVREVLKKEAPPGGPSSERTEPATEGG